MFKKSIKLSHFVVLMSFLIFLFFHLPFFKYVVNHVDMNSFNGYLVLICLMILMVVVNAFVLYIFFYISRPVAKVLLIIFFLINSVALYFVNTYGVIIDETMISNVLNTNYEESSSFISFKMLLYLIFFGILPSIYIAKATIQTVPFKKFITTASFTLLFIIVIAFANSQNWTWIDKNSKSLGGLAMPWNYTVNTALYYKHLRDKNRKEILLPNATITDKQKAVVVLVIGESARSQNFSLYGYEKNTNPLLSQMKDVHHFPANSCATYTTAGVKCILENTPSNDLYEILPNYLFRNNVDVVWRTTNWGEPPVHIKKYQTREYLSTLCKGENCNYDEILLTDLKEQIESSSQNKVLIILHTSTSHGPSYNKKYPPQFETFTPVCTSVELSKCSQSALINAYDNTLVYTDYLLAQIIEDLKELKDYKSAMIFVSDHGESLGEKNLYMHGVPISIAPKEEYEIPFIVWTSEGSKQLKPNKELTQQHVFHSVMNFLSITSPIYQEEMNIFQ